MDVIYTDPAKSPQGLLGTFVLDMAYGSDENNFEIQVPLKDRLQVGSYIYEYGTERGGIIDAERYDSTGDTPVLAYSGRTWHGILDASVVRPNAGADYLVLNGDVHAVFAELIERQGLGAIFKAPDAAAGKTLTNFQVPRYVTLWETVCRIASSVSRRVSIKKADGKVEVGVATRNSYIGGVEGGNMPLSIKNNHRQVNHLVLLGKGELKDRLVRDVYANAAGNVSTTQTLFGIDELAMTYEQSSQEDAAKLISDGKKKLKDMQEPSEVMVYMPPGQEFHLGDIVRGVSPEMGIEAEAEITKQIVSVGTDGVMSISCTVGEATFRDTE